ncbi:protein tweety homolog 2 isoform X1 [Thamnophis elegans]|uniref:protein tweety homolog 2 isoform X1 n=1 Tax=Thamnophis elegans TaxID=35005 RepID=UPI001378D0F1|nr:protein tweety homolog 2 isoform X1 [Thamnophis elegans]
MLLAARAEYLAPWWTSWLHGLPHLSFSLRPVPNAFRPRDDDYQQSLILLALTGVLFLGLNLVFLGIYLICLSCCKKGEESETKKPNSCCITWTAVVAALMCCAAVGIGFYGNSETNDGIYQLIYALDNANHTLSGVDSLVSGTRTQMKIVLEQHVARLNEIFATHSEYVQTLKFMQQMADNIVLQLSGLPVWSDVTVDLSMIANDVSYVEYYRWLSYLLLFILDLVICLIACLGLTKHSRCLLITMLCCGLFTLCLSWASFAADVSAAVGTSDFCVSPDKFILNMTKSDLSAEIVQYYLYCRQSPTSPFQQALTIYQRSLTTMQIQIQGLVQFAVPFFPTAKLLPLLQKDLLDMQKLLNYSEINLHQLTAMLDCRGLHKDYLDALVGICYDGVEGLLYLTLFSLMAAVSFSTIICAMPRAWKHLTSRDRDYDDIDEEDPFNPQARRIAAHNPNRGQLRSFCSYSSSLGSQTSLQPPAQTISNAPVSEYMNQAVLFGGNPRYENVPLIGRGSPPPTYSPSMRATYLAVNDDFRRQPSNEFPA